MDDNGPFYYDIVENHEDKGWRRGKKGQLELTTLVSLGTRKDKKGTPINAPSIHIGALVECWFISAKLGVKLKITKKIDIHEVMKT
jgi:hypothetical protein